MTSSTTVSTAAGAATVPSADGTTDAAMASRTGTAMTRSRASVIAASAPMSNSGPVVASYREGTFRRGKATMTGSSSADGLCPACCFGAAMPLPGNVLAAAFQLGGKLGGLEFRHAPGTLFSVVAADNLHAVVGLH